MICISSRRLAEAADLRARQPLGIATDETALESVRLQAIRDALDRAGRAAMSAPTASSASLWSSRTYGRNWGSEASEMFGDCDRSVNVFPQANIGFAARV